MSRSASKSRAVLLAALVLAAAGLLFFRLGERALRNPDEGRYAEIALEMNRSGDWTEPRLYGSDYLKKPPLFYWLVASSFRLAGPSEAAARAVPALFSLAALLVTYAYARRRLGERDAVFGAVLLGTNAWFLQVGRYLVIDAVFSFFILCSWWAYDARRSAAKRAEARTAEGIFFTSMALAFLTKGLPGLAIPLLTVFLDGALRGESKSARSLNWAAGLAWVALLAGPWLWAITRREPEFWQVFFVREHLARLWSPEFEHQEPWYYYPVMLAVFFLPWTLLVRPMREWRGAWSGEGGRRSPLAYLAACAASVLLFYSAARSKMPTYLVPALAPCALGLGVAWRRWCFGSAEPLRRSVQASLAVFLFLSLAFLVAFPAVSHHFSRRPVPEAVQAVEWLAGTALAGSVLALRSYGRGGPLRLFAALAAMMTALGIAVPLALERFNEDYTTRHLARALVGRLGPSDQVFLYDHPGPFYDFGFYLGRPVRTVGLEGELDITRGDFEAGDASIGRQEFWRLFDGPSAVYALIRRSDFDQLDPSVRARAVVVASDRRKILFANPSAGGNTT